MTTYEWDIETVDIESEDILDHDHRDKLSEYGLDQLIRAINGDRETPTTMTRLVLVRDTEAGRAWAYLNEWGELPNKFLDAYDKPVAPMPKRFVTEFAR